MLLSDRYAEALTYAAAAHHGQFRKGTGIPYIAHPIAVSALAIENGGNQRLPDLRLQAGVFVPPYMDEPVAQLLVPVNAVSGPIIGPSKPLE